MHLAIRPPDNLENRGGLCQVACFALRIFSLRMQRSYLHRHARLTTVLLYYSTTVLYVYTYVLTRSERDLFSGADAHE